MDLDIQHEEGKRYYIPFGDQRAELTYRQNGRTRDFRHTYVPEELRGRRIGEKLVRHALDDTIRNGYRFIPSCPFVERFVERNPQYQDGLERSGAKA